MDWHSSYDVILHILNCTIVFLEGQHIVGREERLAGGSIPIVCILEEVRSEKRL